MDLDDRVPLVDGHVDQHPVPQDAGVVDQHVEPAERLDRGVDQPLGALPVGHVVAVGHGFAAGRPDLVDHLTGWAGGPAAAVDLGAQVVDHDLGPLPGELQGVAPADAPAGSGHDHDPPVTNATHWFTASR